MRGNNFFFFAIFVHYIYFGLENKNKMLVPMKIRKNVRKPARKNRKNKTAHPQQGWSGGMCNGEHSFLESLIYKRCLSQDNNCYISRNKTTETKWKYTRGTTRGRPDHRGEGEGGQGAISIYTSTEKIKKKQKNTNDLRLFFFFRLDTKRVYGGTNRVLWSMLMSATASPEESVHSQL